MIENTDYVPVNTEKFKRAKRRHHIDRIKKRTKRVFKEVWENEDMCREEIVGRWCNNLKRCSCFMCGNERKYGGRKTLQERKAEQSWTDYWNEDTSDEWLWENLSDSYWGWLGGYTSGNPYWCDLCEEEFWGVCPGCGHRPECWWG